jgi:hypothetical protein
MAEIATKGKTRNMPSRDDEHTDATLPPLCVRYYRLMKPHRVSTVEVYWKKAPKPLGEARGEVTLRLIVAGAQVLPSEQTMSAARPDAKAVFYVTPLAKGWLRNEKLEILSQGRKIQEIPMATKVVSQRLTWFLLFCTFFVPWFISEFLKYGPMGESWVVNERRHYHKIAQEVEKHIKENVPPPLEFPPPLDSLNRSPVERFLLDIPGFLGTAFEKMVLVSGILPIAYYSAIGFLGLTLISAFFHMPKRRKSTGKPIPVLSEARA